MSGEKVWWKNCEWVWTKVVQVTESKTQDVLKWFSDWASANSKRECLSGNVICSGCDKDQDLKKRVWWDKYESGSVYVIQAKLEHELENENSLKSPWSVITRVLVSVILKTRDWCLRAKAWISLCDSGNGKESGQAWWCLSKERSGSVEGPLCHGIRELINVATQKCFNFFITENYNLCCVYWELVCTEK